MLSRENRVCGGPLFAGTWPICLVGIILAVARPATPAKAQVPVRSAPTGTYYTLFPLFYDGDYKDASKALAGELRSCIKVGPLRWIDSICYYTMIGECYYEMGDLGRAMECYTAALGLFVANRQWMLRVQFPAAIQPLAARPQTPWGVSTRGTQLGKYPDQTPMLQGQIDNSAAAKYGGVVQLPFMYKVGVQEIVRCTALAIRRRAELLGPLSKYDPLNRDLLNALSQPIAPPNHWSAAYADVELGVALAANGKPNEAATVLSRATAALGQFDHPLTATALLELGKIQLDQDNYAGARQTFLEATYSAYHYGDIGVLEEAFRYASLAHLLANDKAGFGPLADAAAWAKQKRLGQLYASLCLSAAEQALTAGQTPQAMALLNDAQATIARRPMALGRIGARLNFLRATALFQQGKTEPGDESLAAAMRYMSNSSHWLFHIAQVDDFVMGSVRPGHVTPRAALDLYQEVLRDPQPLDWTRDPMESLAVLMTPHAPALEHWFLVAIRRSDQEAALPAALEIADRVRRHRYFSTLAYGGRLQALRWILEAPPEALDSAARLQRQSLLVQYPGYKALSEQARKVRADLASIPVVAADGEMKRRQQSAYAELARLSAQQEAILRQIAVRREPAALVFPPLRSTKEVQQALPKGTAVLVFFAAGGQLHGFLLNQERCRHWMVKGAGQLLPRISNLMREIGNADQNRDLGSKELAATQWREVAGELLSVLLEGSQADFSQQFPELVVVPEGLLWYLPFEALTVKVDGQLQPLISRFRIRYAPTLSLAVADGRGRTLRPETCVVAGRLHPRDEPGVALAAFQQLAKTIPPVVLLDRVPLPAPSALLKVRTSQLIVLDDLGVADLTNYSWPPIPLDRGKPGNSLSDWLALPWGGPEVVILPGLQTPSGSGLKRLPRAGPGTDLFVSVCGLLSTGTRTALMSRWRPGGQSAVELVREFVQELPNTSPADAWQRAVLLLLDSRLNPQAEPRVKLPAGDAPLKGEHPFFWAAYMLVDSGDPPAKAEAGAAERPVPGDKPAAPEKPAQPPHTPEKE